MTKPFDLAQRGFALGGDLLFAVCGYRGKPVRLKLNECLVKTARSRGPKMLGRVEKSKKCQRLVRNKDHKGTISSPDPRTILAFDTRFSLRFLYAQLSPDQRHLEPRPQEGAPSRRASGGFLERARALLGVPIGDAVLDVGSGQVHYPYRDLGRP